MKTYKTLNAGLLAIGLLIGSSVRPALAGDQPAVKSKSISGTITAVDSKEKVMRIRGFLVSRTFVLGQDCNLAQPDTKQATLADFRPGQKVDVTYNDVEGVLVASRITEQQLVYSGKITGLDPAKHLLMVKSSGFSRSFALPPETAISATGNSKAGVGSLTLGSRVQVTYETPNGHWTARRVELTGQQYIGLLDRVNPADRTVTASKRLIGDRTFHLAGDCTILNNGKMDGHLKDLRLGQEYQLNYETVNGVNIVNCITPVPPGPSSQTADRGPQTIPSIPAY